MPGTYGIQQIRNLFEATVSREALVQAEQAGTIPTAPRTEHGSIKRRAWNVEHLPMIGAKYGFLQPIGHSLAVTVFATKGGVLKTTTAFNLARMAALHNVRTLVVGLDLQCDISTALDVYADGDDGDLETALAQVDNTQGLWELHNEGVPVTDLIQDTDIPSLFTIPETPSLALLDRSITNINRREYWLATNVVEPLKQHFDLIIFDCSPNWTELTGNAIVACDVLLSPLECQVNHARNVKIFQQLVEEFKAQMELRFSQVYVPTKFNAQTKLGREIRKHYLAEVENVTATVLRQGVKGEEAMASRLSLPEYAPRSAEAQEVRDLTKELWDRFRDHIEANTPSPAAVA